MKLNLFLIIVFVAATLNRVHAQGTLEKIPVLLFSGQSKPGDESPSLEVQSENAEKGVIDSKQSEEVIEYVDESEPGADLDSEVDQMEVDETAKALEGSARVHYNIQNIEIEPVPVVGRAIIYQQNNETDSNPSIPFHGGRRENEGKLSRNQVTWVFMGILLLILFLIILALALLKCCRKRRRRDLATGSTAGISQTTM